MTGNFYLGVGGGASGAAHPNTLAFIISRLLNRRTHVELVRVVSVTNSPGELTGVGQVSVLPLVNEIDGYGNAQPHTTVSNLCYFRYQGGGNAVLIDPVVGDIGVAVIADKDTSVVKATGAQGNPGSRGRSRREYGIYIGLCLGGSTITQSLAFTQDSVTLTTGSGGFIVNGATITAAGEVIDALGKVLGTHEHGGVQTGGSNTGPPI